MKSRNGRIDLRRVSNDIDNRLMDEPLEQEWEFYLVNKKRLLAEHAGEHVVIYGEEILGFAEFFDEGIKIGVDHCGPTTPFLVHEIVEVEPVLYLPFGMV